MISASPVDLIAACRNKPVAFNRHVLGRIHPSLPEGYHPKQIEVLQSVLENRYTMVPAGHGVGKSYGTVGAALHFAQTRHNSRVLLFGPTFDQLNEVLWAELSDAFKNATVPLAGRLIGGNSPKLLIAEKWGIWGSSVGGEGVSKAGRHAGQMLICCDEACAEGYDDLIEDLEGLNASNYLFIGNPLRHGKFKRLCDMADAGTDGYKKITISSLDSPHAHLKRSPVGLADRDYIEGMRQTYGEDSPQWRARVLGEFNADDSFCLIPSSWMDRCLQEPPDINHGARVLSVDLSKGTGRGDNSVIIVRDRDRLLFMDWSASWHYPDGVAAKVREAADAWGISGDRVVYDEGGLGAGFRHSLDQVGLHGAYGYVGGEGGGNKATNFRGACALALKDRLDPSRNPVVFHIPAKWLDVLKPQVAELRYELAMKDKIKLENKMDMKERMGSRSPDQLDALIMSFARSF